MGQPGARSRIAKAAESAHCVVGPHHPPCSCQRRPCMETCGLLCKTASPSSILGGTSLLVVEAASTLKALASDHSRGLWKGCSVFRASAASALK